MDRQSPVAREVIVGRDDRPGGLIMVVIMRKRWVVRAVAPQCGDQPSSRCRRPPGQAVSSRSSHYAGGVREELQRGIHAAPLRPVPGRGASACSCSASPSASATSSRGGTRSCHGNTGRNLGGHVPAAGSSGPDGQSRGIQFDEILRVAVLVQNWLAAAAGSWSRRVSGIVQRAAVDGRLKTED